MGRIWRRLLVVLLVVLGIGVVLVVAVRNYLASSAAAARVTAGLEAQYGGPVQVGKVEIGLRSSTVEDLKLYEEGAQPGSEPWATFRDIEADVSLSSLVSGTPHVRRLDVTGADLTLRFDRAGHLLTRLPKQKQTGVPLPDVHLRQSRVAIDQEGRHPFVVGGVDAEIRSQDGRLVLDGTIQDKRWGDWDLMGSLDRTSGASTGTLRSKGRVHVTQAMLEDLPFVSPTVWADVQAEGDTPVVFTLRYEPEKHAVHYKVELEPENTHVHVTPIDLTAEQASGKVTIEDAVVRLEKVRGRVADGTMANDAVLDFHTTPDRLTFTIDAEGLDLAKLPKKWKVPSQLGGRLTGHAELVVTIRDGQVRTSGEGEGTITQARVMNLPARPIRLRLYSEGDGFHFGMPKHNTDATRSGAQLPGWVALTGVLFGAPPAGRGSDSVFTPGEAANRVGSGILDAAGNLTDAGVRALRTVPKRSRALPGGGKPAGQPASYLEANLALDDVDVAQLVSQLKMKLPVPVTGRVSVQVRVAFPIDSPGDLKAYRVNGTAQSKQLSIAGVELRQLHARVNYADGVLRLEELRSRVPSGRQSDEGPAVVGSFEGSARLGIAPPGEATASLTLDHVPVDRALALVPGPAPHAEGTVSGTVAARAPGAHLEDVTAWAAQGHLETDRLVAYGLTLSDARADVGLDHGEVSLSAFRGKLAGASVSGSGRLDLRTSFGDAKAGAKPEAGRVSLAFKDLDVGGFVGDLLKAVTPAGNRPLGKPAAVPVQGQADGTLTATLPAGGLAKEINVDAKVELRSPRLRVQGLVTERVHGTLAFRNGVLEYHLEAALAGGTLKLEGQVPARGSPPGQPPQAARDRDGDVIPVRQAVAGQSGEGRLRIEGAQLSQLLQQLGIPAGQVPLRGTLDLDLPFTQSSLGEIPTGVGTVVLRRLRWHREELAGEVRATVRLTPRELRFSDVSAIVGQGILRGAAALPLRAGDRGWFSVALDNVEAARLLAPWPDLAGRVEGPLTISLRGTLDHEWSGSGQVTLVHGRILGVEVTDWRVPVDFIVSPRGNYGQLDVRDSTAQVALGRLTGKASLSFDSVNRLEGTLRFTGVDLPTLLRGMTEQSQVGPGKVTGKVDFGANDLRSVNDLSATIEASLQQTQALNYPVLQQVAPFLGAGQSSTSFQNGDLRARLDRGVVRVQRLTLTGSRLQLFVQGTVTLEGRLALEVIANTGQFGYSPTFLRFLGLRIPAVGPIPVSLLLEASTYLSNRTVHLRVTGTVRSPSVQVEPVSLLSEEAVRFFLNRTTLPIP